MSASGRTLRQRVERRFALGVLGMPAGLLARLAGPATDRDGHTLDRKAQLAFKLSKLAGRKGAEVLGPAAYRRELDELGTALGPKPLHMAEVREVSFPVDDGSRQRGRLYVPHAAEAPAAGLVFFHGGGFVGGSLDSHDSICRVLADGARCRVLACEYRLSPEHKHPAAVLDAEAAFAFAVREASTLGLDPDRLAIGGDSAGGNLTAVLALARRGDGGEPGRPICQLLIYPAVDLTMSFPSIQSLGAGFLLEEPTIRWFRDQYLEASQDRRDPRVSPYFADVTSAPRAIVVTAGFDPLRDEGAAYEAKLRAAGVAVTHLSFGSLFHGFLHATGAIESTRIALAEIASELGRVLHASRAAEPRRISGSR